MPLGSLLTCHPCRLNGSIIETQMLLSVTWDPRGPVLYQLPWFRDVSGVHQKVSSEAMQLEHTGSTYLASGLTGSTKNIKKVTI